MRGALRTPLAPRSQHKWNLIKWQLYIYSEPKTTAINLKALSQWGKFGFGLPAQTQIWAVDINLIARRYRASVPITGHLEYHTTWQGAYPASA